ncbi:MAG: hypothetical protein AAF824_11995 [Bacteroidota bacterium]
MDKHIYDADPAQFDYLINEGYEFRLGDYISRGWELFKMNTGGFVGYTMVFFLASLISSSIPFLGSLIGLAIGAPMTAGFFIVARKLANNEAVEFSDFFLGFEHITQLVLGNIVMAIFVCIGFLLLLLPGFYLAIAYGFVYMIIVFEKMEFMKAMEVSRKVITKNWWNFLLMALVYVGIMLLGAIALGVGLLVAFPTIYCISYAAYEDIMGVPDETMMDKIDEIGQEIKPEEFDEKF